MVSLSAACIVCNVHDRLCILNDSICAYKALCKVCSMQKDIIPGSWISCMYNQPSNPARKHLHNSTEIQSSRGSLVFHNYAEVPKFAWYYIYCWRHAVCVPLNQQQVIAAIYIYILRNRHCYSNNISILEPDIILWDSKQKRAHKLSSKPNQPYGSIDLVWGSTDDRNKSSTTLTRQLTHLLNTLKAHVRASITFWERSIENLSLVDRNSLTVQRSLQKIRCPITPFGGSLGAFDFFAPSCQNTGDLLRRLSPSEALTLTGRKVFSLSPSLHCGRELLTFS